VVKPELSNQTYSFFPASSFRIYQSFSALFKISQTGKVRKKTHLCNYQEESTL